jgi:hypothetical protein
LARQPPIVGPGTTAEHRFSAAGVSEYRVFFIDHAVVSLPAMRPLRVTAPKFGRTKELARARRLCYYL